MKLTPEETKVQIRRDREEQGLTITRLAFKYGLSRSTIFNVVRDCDASKVMRSSPVKRIVDKVEHKSRPLLSKSDLGEATRQMICARMMFDGIKVFRPMTEDTPTDLLVLTSVGKIFKCQCKYIFPTKRGAHCMILCSVRKNGPGSKAVKHRYTLDEVDIFLGYCLDNDSVYIIPNQDTKGKQNLRLWVSRQPIGRANIESFDSEKYRNNFALLK